MPLLRLSCAPGRLWMTRRRKSPTTTRTPTPTNRRTPSPARAQVLPPFCPFHLISLFTFASSLKKMPHFPIPSPNYPSIPRCSDFLLLPQTPPHPILSPEHHASLRVMVARHRPPTAPWAAAAAAVCSAVGLHLTMTHIHPRPIHLLYPATA